MNRIISASVIRKQRGLMSGCILLSSDWERTDGGGACGAARS